MKTKGIKINRTDRGEPVTKNSWPRHKVDKVKCRERDLVIRITNWLDDEEEPAIDVEMYIAGVYDWNESEAFSTLNAGRTKQQAKALALEFAQQKMKQHFPA